MAGLELDDLAAGVALHEAIAEQRVGFLLAPAP
jgi:hypothetical protein